MSVPRTKLIFFDFEIATYGFMATNFQKTVPELSLRHCKVVETIHAADQEQVEQRAEKFKIGKVKKYFDGAINAVSATEP